jgi:hypothetical protein
MIFIVYNQQCSFYASFFDEAIIWKGFHKTDCFPDKHKMAIFMWQKVIAFLRLAPK